MRILKSRVEVFIDAARTVLTRFVFTDNTIEWWHDENKILQANDLEKEYQSLINKPHEYIP